MRSPHAHDRHKALGWIMLAGGALMLLFWSLYLTGAMELGQHDPMIAAFESAFILADTALGFFLCASGWTLLRGSPKGPYLMVIAAAMSLYLGLLDLAFYAQAGLYASLTAAAAFELALNTICIAGGATCLRFGWKLMHGSEPASTRHPGVVPLRRRPDLEGTPKRWIGGAA
jgi:hypothetical protein